MNDDIKIKRSHNINNREYSFGEFFHQILDLKKDDGTPKLDDESKAKLKEKQEISLVN